MDELLDTENDNHPDNGVIAEHDCQEHLELYGWEALECQICGDLFDRFHNHE